ncbi:HAD-superfamily hydrolase [Xylariaceae sp. FL1651]|nr:HAD-superfamily hydrolase [Xylariaceae sp. FL1651]
MEIAKLTIFTAISFDVYATLIDWETGIYTALAPLNDRLPTDHAFKDNRRGLLELYTHFEGILEDRHPEMKYAQLLGEVYSEMATHMGITLDPSLPSTAVEKATFGSSVGVWPAFPDTVEALKILAARYKLIVLSNVDGESFESTRTGPLGGIEFDAVYTAQDIGSYKPDLRNFKYMVKHAERDLGVVRDGFLHTAQALKHDHVPAQRAGLKSCWIERAGDDAVIGGKLSDFGDEIQLAYRFKTLGDMAAAVERAFGKID